MLGLTYISLPRFIILFIVSLFCFTSFRIVPEVSLLVSTSVSPQDWSCLIFYCCWNVFHFVYVWFLNFFLYVKQFWIGFQILTTIKLWGFWILLFFSNECSFFIRLLSWLKWTCTLCFFNGNYNVNSCSFCLFAFANLLQFCATHACFRGQ